MVGALSQLTKGEKDAAVAAFEAVTVTASLAYEPIKDFDNSVGTFGASAFYSSGNDLESALDGFLKAAEDAKFKIGNPECARYLRPEPESCARFLRKRRNSKTT